MADVFSVEKRSEIMSRIRGKWTKHERKAHGLLKSRKIRHKMHPEIAGNPDILLKDRKIVIFMDGCFWHGCRRCYQEPRTNRSYWIPKIENNMKRDRHHSNLLRKEGYEVIRIWEHAMNKDPIIILRRIGNVDKNIGEI